MKRSSFLECLGHGSARSATRSAMKDLDFGKLQLMSTWQEWVSLDALFAWE